jgi:AbrB family transcriptional regulator (stage V sporulation protein T)
MKATGIVRRIDDLGRVVIPKEIRRTMRIREGDPLEIYTNREGEVIFKKYSPIGELSSFAAEYADTLSKICDLSVVITDRDAVIACAGVSRKEYTDKRISKELEEIITDRQLYVYGGDKEKVYVSEESDSHYVRCAMPIISEGDLIGCVCSLGDEEEQPGNLHTSAEEKLIQTAANFLSKQHES